MQVIHLFYFLHKKFGIPLVSCFCRIPKYWPVPCWMFLRLCHVAFDTMLKLWADKIVVFFSSSFMVIVFATKMKFNVCIINSEVILWNHKYYKTFLITCKKVVTLGIGLRSSDIFAVISVGMCFLDVLVVCFGRWDMSTMWLFPGSRNLLLYFTMRSLWNIEKSFWDFYFIAFQSFLTNLFLTKIRQLLGELFRKLLNHMFAQNSCGIFFYAC